MVLGVAADNAPTEDVCGMSVPQRVPWRCRSSGQRWHRGREGALLRLGLFARLERPLTFLLAPLLDLLGRFEEPLRRGLSMIPRSLLLLLLLLLLLMLLLLLLLLGC